MLQIRRKEVEKIINIVKTNKTFYTNEFQFFNKDEKNKTVSVYSPCKQFLSDGFEFKYNL